MLVDFRRTRAGTFSDRKRMGASVGTWCRIATLGVVLSGASAAQATTNDMARELCNDNLIRNQGAIEVRIRELRRHNQVPYVYGSADFSDAKNVRFRCRVYDDEVREVSYLMSDPSLLEGVVWSDKRPQGTEHEDLVIDEAAMAPPPAESIEPGPVDVPMTDGNATAAGAAETAPPRRPQDVEPHFEKPPKAPE